MQTSVDEARTLRDTERLVVLTWTLNAKKNGTGEVEYKYKDGKAQAASRHRLWLENWEQAQCVQRGTWSYKPARIDSFGGDMSDVVEHGGRPPDTKG